MDVTAILMALLSGVLTQQQPMRANRPLWILEDQLAKRERENRQELLETSTTLEPPRQARYMEPASITFLVRQGAPQAATGQSQPLPLALSLPQPVAQPRHMLPRRLQLPHSYVQQRRHSHKPAAVAQRRRQPMALPIFDSAPGDNALPMADQYPLFVYNGTRGELIVNTMLSTQRYPMKEPVPGQVLYPPSTPMFRPKPIVERFRFPGHRELLNLTLIPFYAHEAISPPTSLMLSTRPPPPHTTTDATPHETQLPRSHRKRKRKKAKQYTAYHSPQEVQWQPTLPASLQTTRHHRHNHRQPTDSNESSQSLGLELELGSLEQEIEQLQQQLLPSKEPELVQTTTSSPPSSFHIVYVDESLERPHTGAPSEQPESTTITPPVQRQSSRYAGKREFYAFPVYTLGKLLQEPGSIISRNSVGSPFRGDASTEHEPNNTWFILNSRYKGPHHSSQTYGKTKYYTSKYTQNAINLKT
ncbi:uncharacterized protein LOC115629706 [Scaptodrosophila lebanonensis]|uniref:Uncharacterized protein LOC115629706 n=1 Tax=Drosophila lebanonensis TaxID=7225 RepID=A0A6J2U043_DROLE|nr:uncharacterized protein LOC115629706 [Scaptodrosophila lebanonensis]